MASTLQPWQVFLAALAGWINRHQQDAIELRGRRVRFAGMTPGPDEAFIRRVGRNLTDPADGFLHEKRFCLMDRDAKITTAFRTLFAGDGIEPVRLPPRSPNLNARVAPLRPSRSGVSIRAASVGVARGQAWCADGRVRIRNSVIERTIACDTPLAEPRPRCARRRIERHLCFWTIREGTSEFDDSEFARRVLLRLGDDQPRDVFVKSAEDTMLRKLLSFRLGGEASDRQWSDVRGIVGVQAGNLDAPYLIHWAERLGIRDLLDRLMGHV